MTTIPVEKFVEYWSNQMAIVFVEPLFLGTHFADMRRFLESRDVAEAPHDALLQMLKVTINILAGEAKDRGGNLTGLTDKEIAEGENVPAA